MNELEHLLSRIVYFMVKWEFTDYELGELIGISKLTVKRLNDNINRYKNKQPLLGIHVLTLEKLKKFVASEELLQEREAVPALPRLCRTSKKSKEKESK